MSIWKEVVWHAKQLFPFSYEGGGLKWRMWMGKCYDVREA
jgi:hypothetical protein